MNLRPVVIIVICLTVGLAGITVPATGAVQILSPEQGAVVHGVVNITATKPQPEDGWITYSIQPSRDANLAAVMSPFVVRWNTQVYSDDKRVYDDGQYTIKAVGFDGSGRREGEDTVQITVVNSIDAAEVGGTVELKSNYQRGQILTYEIEGKTTVNVPGEAGKELREPPKMEMGMGGEGMMGMEEYGMMGMEEYGMMGPGMMAGGMGAGAGTSQIEGLPSNVELEIAGGWDEEVLSPTATGRAVIDREILRGYYTASWLWPKKEEKENVPDSYAQVLPAAGGEYRFKIFPLGWVEKMHEEQPEFPLGHSFIELSVGPVQVGATWQGKMAYTPSSTSTEPTIISVIHRLDSFEYCGNHRCARIVSKHTERDATIKIAGLLPWRQQQIGAGGMLGASMAPGMGAMPGAMPAMRPGMPSAGPGMEMGMPGGGLGMGPGGMGGTGGMAGGATVSEYKGDISVERVTYFSLDEGRIIAFEDTITRKINKAVTTKGEVERLSGEKESFETIDDLNVDQVRPIISSLVGAAGGMGMEAGMMAGGGMMGPGMPGGMSAMGGYGMGMPPQMGYGGGMMGEGGMMDMMKPSTKATLEITTEWFVYDKTAGISQYAVVPAEEKGTGGGGWVLPSETYAQEQAFGQATSRTGEGTTFAVDLNSRGFRPVSSSYQPQGHEELVNTTRNYLLSLGYEPQ